MTTLQEVLQLPSLDKCKKPTKKIQGTACLPKHLSGTEVISFLEERKKAREEKEKEKEEGQKKREERKKAREQEEKERERHREQKKKEKEAKQAEEREKEEQKKQKEQKVTGQRKKSSRATKGNKRQEDVCKCPKCHEIYDDDCEEIWVECEGCSQWFHLTCTTLNPNENLDLFVSIVARPLHMTNVMFSCNFSHNYL